MMKVAFVIMTLISYVSAQGSGSGYEVTTWPQNIDTNGGAIVQLYHPPLGNGSCIVTLPAAVELFHVSNQSIGLLILFPSTQRFPNLIGPLMPYLSLDYFYGSLRFP